VRLRRNHILETHSIQMCVTSHFCPIMKCVVSSEVWMGRGKRLLLRDGFKPKLLRSMSQDRYTLSGQLFDRSISTFKEYPSLPVFVTTVTGRSRLVNWPQRNSSYSVTVLSGSQEYPSVHMPYSVTVLSGYQEYPSVHMPPRG
jgi:hypothetical protein